MAFATALPLFKGELKMENPYFNYEIIKRKGKKPNRITEEGIYIFGGRLANGDITNDLRVAPYIS